MVQHPGHPSLPLSDFEAVGFAPSEPSDPKELVVAQTSTPLRPLRVLVVEDDIVLRESLCLHIGQWGHTCESTPAVPEALRAASAFRPDVVLMDIGLPAGMVGWETARTMRKLPGLSETVFVAVTGHSRRENVDRSYAAGFAAHFTKPFGICRSNSWTSSKPSRRSRAGLKPDATS